MFGLEWNCWNWWLSGIFCGLSDVVGIVFDWFDSENVGSVIVSLDFGRVVLLGCGDGLDCVVRYWLIFWGWGVFGCCVSEMLVGGCLWVFFLKWFFIGKFYWDGVYWFWSWLVFFVIVVIYCFWFYC